MKRNPYETARYLHEYLLFHYGKPADQCPFEFVPRAALRFHERLRKECLLPIKGSGPVRALDIGCGVGRFSFELGTVADEVVGIDNSEPFVNAARRMARGRSVTVTIPESGASVSKRTLLLPRALRTSHVRFEVGDALDLRTLRASPFHIVTAINLLCRLPSPRKFLESLSALVARGGQLLIASPFSWLEQYTPKREWLNSEQVERLLRRDFRLIQRRDLPFLIREHRRKYQLVVSEVATFLRK